MLYKLLFFLFALFAVQVHSYANPLACSGTCTNTHDPSIVRRSSDGTYYRFATGGGVAIHSGSSIQGPWTYQGYALASGSKISNSGADDIWVRLQLHLDVMLHHTKTDVHQAPDVHQIGSTYYMYYSVSSFGTQDSVIGLATSTTMDVGSWTDHGSIGISSNSSKSYNAIDPNLIAVGSSYYMNFGSFWHDLYQAPMKTTPTAASGSAYNTAYNASGNHGIEGSYMINYSGYYYLFFSSGQCCNYDTSKPAPGGEYKIMVCRSQTAIGNFVDQNGKSCLTQNGGSIVLQSHGTVYGPGGQGVYDDPQLGWVVYYHYVDTTIGYADADKRLGVNKLAWSNGWPTV